ncbi:hypothetical protein [Clostridium botulinum]|uniref:Uncharacterized protein n=1 Tax=Clostridium botulinum TaxID=1491 RepID=A0A1L7JMN0_CLOBO|nr:hypothetical protein [Clostridium botulinum]APU87030.1 hypothetical protein NPD8_3944 [Clostridium botulinum]
MHYGKKSKIKSIVTKFTTDAMESQCKSCCHNKNMMCTRIGTNGTVGVCWMESSEGEY